jgi:hypothetical protein
MTLELVEGDQDQGPDDGSEMQRRGDRQGHGGDFCTGLDMKEGLCDFLCKWI